MHAGLLFLVVYAATVIAQRFEESLAAQEELLRRAQGSRRAFKMLDWTPTP
jgi:hypothetical protein